MDKYTRRITFVYNENDKLGSIYYESSQNISMTGLHLLTIHENS